MRVGPESACASLAMAGVVISRSKEPNTVSPTTCVDRGLRLGEERLGGHLYDFLALAGAGYPAKAR